MTKTPCYLPDFTLCKHGYNDGGSGVSDFFDGEPPEVHGDCPTINAFLNAMEFESGADRTNGLAALLTCTLRNFWPGAKPILAVTATKSHSGKDTVIEFASGQHCVAPSRTRLPTGALQRSITDAIQAYPELGVMFLGMCESTVVGMRLSQDLLSV